MMKSLYVRKVRMWVGQVFDWAIEQGYAEANVATTINPKKAFGKTRVKHFAGRRLAQAPEDRGHCP